MRLARGLSSALARGLGQHPFGIHLVKEALPRGIAAGSRGIADVVPRMHGVGSCTAAETALGGRHAWASIG